MDTNYETFATWIQITRHGYKLRDFCNMDTNYETFGDTHWAPTNHLIRENVRNTRRWAVIGVTKRMGIFPVDLRSLNPCLGMAFLTPLMHWMGPSSPMHTYVSSESKLGLPLWMRKERQSEFQVALFAFIIAILAWILRDTFVHGTAHSRFERAGPKWGRTR